MTVELSKTTPVIRQMIKTPNNKIMIVKSIGIVGIILNLPIIAIIIKSAASIRKALIEVAYNFL